MIIIKLTLSVIVFALILQCARADAPAAEASPTNSDPCANCLSNGLKCLSCGDGRHACITQKQADANPVCCGCKGKGPGSICTLCLPTEPCIESKQSTFSGYYCYNPSYLEVLDAAINQTQYPYNYVDLLPTAGQKAGWIILGTSIALVVLSLGLVLILCLFGWGVSTATVCTFHGGGGGGSDYGSSWSNDNSYSNDNSSSGGNDNSSSSSSWDSGPSYAASAD